MKIMRNIAKIEDGVIKETLLRGSWINEKNIII